jgi:hypothetical protein
MEQEQLLLDSLERDILVRRRKLLPIWIKIFIWIFIVFGALGLLGFTAALFSANFDASFYGLQTNDPSSRTGLFICFLFVFKGIVSLGLWTEKNWAVDLGIIDAILGITVCSATMILPFTGSDMSFSFRLELLLLIPYLIKLLKIRREWKDA